VTVHKESGSGYITQYVTSSIHDVSPICISLYRAESNVRVSLVSLPHYSMCVCVFGGARLFPLALPPITHMLPLSLVLHISPILSVSKVQVVKLFRTLVATRSDFTRFRCKEIRTDPGRHKAYISFPTHFQLSCHLPQGAVTASSRRFNELYVVRRSTTPTN
jgi:hypothetical protein